MGIRNIPRLEDWTIDSDGLFLSGQVYGDSRFAEGEQIDTSPLVLLDVSGRLAKTENGTYYRLGARKPDQHVLQAQTNSPVVRVKPPPPSLVDKVTRRRPKPKL